MTFDDGPSQFSNALMDILTANNVQVSYFLVGMQIDAFKAQINREVSLGHSTLSHTYTHPDLLLQTSEGIYNEFAKTNAAFVKSGVCKRPTLYRPPYGNTNATITDLTGRMGMRGIIWTIDTLDWSLAKSNPTKMLADFKTNLAATGSAGVIHLQHDLLLESVNLVPQLLATIKANTPKKDAFISIEQCVWGPGYLTHPSYVFMNRLCPATISKWPAVTTGCPVSDWSVWSPCDSNCGPGVSTRVRYSLPPTLASTVACASVASSTGGGFIQSQACNAAKACPTTGCSFSAWTVWSACSKPCGGGTQVSSRQVTAGATTCGPVLKTQLCNTQACTGAVLSGKKIKKATKKALQASIKSAQVAK